MLSEVTPSLSAAKFTTMRWRSTGRATERTSSTYDRANVSRDLVAKLEQGRRHTARIASLASLKLLESRSSIQQRRLLEATLRESLAGLWSLPNVGDIRQVGLVAGIELVRDWRTRGKSPVFSCMWRTKGVILARASSGCQTSHAYSSSRWLS